MKRTNVFTILLFIFLGYLPALGGLFTDTGTWYASLQKPAFNPPGWIFSPVWTVLYLTIGLSFYFLYRGMSRFGWKMWGLVAVHQFLNFSWTPAFFYLKSPLLALAVVLLLLAVIVRFILIQTRCSRPALYLFIPYSMWVCFAAVLNTSIWYLNSNQLS